MRDRLFAVVQSPQSCWLTGASRVGGAKAVASAGPNRGWRLLLWFLCVLPLALVEGAAASDDTLRSRVERLGTPSWHGEVTVYYSEGAEARAKSFGTLVEEATQYSAEPTTLNQPLELSLAVLDPHDWAAVVPRPYGVPFLWHPPGEPKIAFLPATSDSPIVALNLRMAERLSEPMRLRFSDLGLGFEEAARQFADLLVLHEIGHAYASQLTTRHRQAWLNEFLATFLAFEFLADRYPQKARVWDAVNDAIVEAATHPHTTLRDFDQLYIAVGLENYGWYQGNFQQLAAEVVEQSGLRFILDFREAWLAAPDGSEEDPRRLRLVAGVFPGVVRWAVGPEGQLAPEVEGATD